MKPVLTVYMKCMVEVKGPWEKAVLSMQLVISHGPFLARAKRKQRREESQLLPSFSFSVFTLAWKRTCAVTLSTVVRHFEVLINLIQEN